jgi:2-isopropylmalate synthase
MKKIQIYDTTLRDGSQGENISFSMEDKLHIVKKLDELGVDYVEGGWPGSNAKDVAFFERAQGLKLKHAKLAAFGSTCHPRHSVANDRNLQSLIEAGTPVVTIFGKSWDLHVKVALGVSLKENLDLIRNSVVFLKSHGREVIYDAEHFFDGYKADPDYALATLKAAEEAGADLLVLCDTNGGTLTNDIHDYFQAAAKQLKAPLGIHTHNDCEMAVANSIAAVQQGAVQVQGTINGYGERCGNANLCSVIANLELKLGMRSIGRENLQRLTEVARYVSELVNLPLRTDLPYVGKSAFAEEEP